MAAMLSLAAMTARADEALVHVETDSLRATWSSLGARLISLESKVDSGALRRDSASHLAVLAEALEIRLVGRAKQGDFDALPYTIERRNRPGSIELCFRARIGGAHTLEQIYEIPRRGFELRWSAIGTPARDAREAGRPAELWLAGGLAFRARPWVGWGASSERVIPVVIDATGVRELDQAASLPLHADAWTGVRSRYWALLVAGDGTAHSSSESPLRITVSSKELASVRIFAGPLTRAALASTDPKLSALQLGDVILPIRILAQGFGSLLEALTGALGGIVGLAIVLLSVVNRLLLLPLTRIAERWQRDVDEIRTRLSPELSAIRMESRAEERGQRIFALYRAHDVSPFYGVKSLLGVAVQLPVFLAMYHMLDENVALAGRGFLWIEDLSRPDRVLALPFSIPLLGAELHVLPTLMLLVACLAARIHSETTADSQLRRARQRGLYAMAGVFFLLFYTFPAGMLLYWTMNNCLSLVREWMHHAVSHVRRARAGVDKCMSISS